MLYQEFSTCPVHPLPLTWAIQSNKWLVEKSAHLNNRRCTVHLLEFASITGFDTGSSDKQEQALQDLPQTSQPSPGDRASLVVYRGKFYIDALDAVLL